MPLVFNGTTIPTNVANALMYNGTSVTQVVFNGTTVWQQSLFGGIWSGSSDPGQIPYRGVCKVLETSGSASRLKVYGSWYSEGGWIYTNSSGLGSGRSTTGTIANTCYYHEYAGNTGIRCGVGCYTITWSGYIPFSVSSKFSSVNVDAQSSILLQGSTPYIRSGTNTGAASWAYGGWITIN